MHAVSHPPVSPEQQSSTPKLTLSLTGLVEAAGALVCLFTLTGFFGRWSWVFEITSHFRAQYALLLVGFGLLAVWQRHRLKAAVFLAFGSLNFWLLVPFLFGTPGQMTTRSTPSVRLLLWNVNSANRNFAEFSRLLSEHDPDIVSLIEVSPEWKRFLHDTMTTFPHQRVEARNDNFGIAMFSRIPIESMRVRYLGAASLPSISAELVSGDRTISLLATHPLPPAGGSEARYRDEQLQAVAKWAREQSGEVVVTGDLNITPWSPMFAEFLESADLHNSAEGNGVGGTWPAFFPPMLIPIDHFLHTDEVVVTRREVAKAKGSDHLPLLVEFGLK